MATGRKDSTGPDEPKDEFDNLGDGGSDGGSGDDGDEYFAGYRRPGRIVFVIDHENTEEEHLERQRVLMNPQTLEEKIEAYVLGSLIEIDGKIMEDFPPLVEGLEKCGITLAELFELVPELAPQQTDMKGRPI